MSTANNRETQLEEAPFLSSGEEEKEDDTQLIPSSDSPPPKDTYLLVYIAFLILGIVLLFPYNSFILAIDYFHYLYPDQRAEFVLPLVYLIVTLIFVALNVTIVNLVNIHLRICFGYILFTISLAIVPLLDIGVNNCTVSTDVGFTLTLIATIIVGVGSGIQQTSLYGLGGMLPEKYTQALMLGEALSGTILITSRIITKGSAVGLERIGAIAFFVISLIVVILCGLSYVFLIRRSSYVKYYMNKNSLNYSEERKSLPFNRETRNWSFSYLESLLGRFYRHIKGGLIARIKIVKKVWQIILSVALTFFVTLWIYPSLPADVQNCTINDWSPIIVIGVFQVADTLSRFCGLIPIRWNSKLFVGVSLIRILLVPIMVLCVSPSPTHPVIKAPLIVGSFIMLILGASNGYFGLLGMQYAPTMVDDNERELTGNIMVFSLLGGLTIGSVLANIWTPLISLAPFIPCTNNTALFHCNIQENNTYTF